MRTADALRIAVVNLMPAAERYEAELIAPLAASGFSIECVWIRLHQRNYSTCDRAHLDHHYEYFSQAKDTRRFHGVILTGAAVDHVPYECVAFMPELSSIIRCCHRQGCPILGICWGALALGHVTLNLEKRSYQRKLLD